MKNSKKAGFYPVLINLQSFNCIVVGGGKVAYRKVLSLLKFGADVTVLSPKIMKPIMELAKQNSIKVIHKSYSEEYIKGYKIAFSATDNPELNRTVRKDCTKNGILLNVVDDPVLCDFILPANVIRGDLTISISSQGNAPFFTKKMKTKIEELISPVYEEIFTMAGKLRRQIMVNNHIDSKTRTKILKKFASQNWEEILSHNGRKTPQRHLKEILKEFNLK